jgi:UDP:flavonoid glycosyltransferase YjiC (YdhE family)
VKIALVPNDDGYGPSALGFYVAKALLKQGVSLVIMNESALTLNASFYKDEINSGKVTLQPTFGGIRLRKTAEGVDIPASLRDIRSYPTRSAKYVVPEDVDAVVDIGTPSAARAARLAGKPAITIFDHSWGKTYEMLLEEFTAGVLGPTTSALPIIKRDYEVAKAINELKEDESKAQAVFLFPEFIAPRPYREHWKSLRVRIEPIGGVFGRPAVSRKKARSTMGIPEGAPAKTVYMLGGGTSVWDAKLPEIIQQLKEKSLLYNVVVFDRNAKPNEYVRVGNNVFKGGVIDGATVQGLLPGIDLVITRAGGGIVNDSIACRVPLVCVEEPNHLQVEMIRQNCEKEGLTRTIRIGDFRDCAIGEIIEKELGNQAGNRRIRKAMQGIRNGMEEPVAATIIQLCSPSRSTSGPTMPSSRRRQRRGSE